MEIIFIWSWNSFKPNIWLSCENEIEEFKDLTLFSYGFCQYKFTT